MINRENVFREALRVYGPETQALTAMEELCESAVAVNHYRRGKLPDEEFVDELADALIVIEQQLFLAGLEGKVQDAMERKLIRFSKRMVEDDLNKVMLK